MPRDGRTAHHAAGPGGNLLVERPCAQMQRGTSSVQWIPVHARGPGLAVVVGAGVVEIVAGHRQAGVPALSVHPLGQLDTEQAALRQHQRADHVAFLERRVGGAAGAIDTAIVQAVAHREIGRQAEQGVVQRGVDRLPGHRVVGEVTLHHPAQCAVASLGPQAHRTDLGARNVAITDRRTVRTGGIDEQAAAGTEHRSAVGAAELGCALGPGDLGLPGLAGFQCGHPRFQRGRRRRG